MSVQSQIDRLNAIKDRIRTNLVAQGITVPEDAMLEAMAEQILSVAGEDGQRGTGLLAVTTAPSSYTTAVGGITPKYRMAISTIKTQAGVTEVLLGDTIRSSYYHYPIAYLDSSYAYCTTRVSIRGATGAAGADGKDYSFNPTVYGLPVLELTGDISPIAVSKDNKVTLSYVYGERSGSCTLKGQGATSYKKAQALVNEGKAGKFNYTINFDTAFEAKTGWGSQKKYCLKANFIDHTHSRNIVNATIWGKFTKERTGVPSAISALPHAGAIDGFPIVIMLNGEFHGLYTFNIPKDGWMFGLIEDTTKTQAIVGANDHETATQFKGEVAGDESDFELEFVSDKNNSAWVNTSLNRLINACIDSWGGDLDTTVAQYLDWGSAIDYYIFTVLINGADMVDKNYLLVTFDGTKWYFSVYDMDTTYGLVWDGSTSYRPNTGVTFASCADVNRVMELIKRFKTNELKARYTELRADRLSVYRIYQEFENFAWAIPSPVLIEDVKRYPTIPGTYVNNIDSILRWIDKRLEICDKWINALPAQETPVEPEQPVEPEEPVETVNLVPTSTDTDGSVYNGTGYKDDVRLSSSGGVSSSAQAGSVTTGFMPWQSRGVIRIKGATFPYDSTKHYYISFYNADKTLVNANTYYSDDYFSDGNPDLIKSYDETTGVTTIDTSPIGDPSSNPRNAGPVNAAYFRMTLLGKGADLIVTVNQEITV